MLHFLADRAGLPVFSDFTRECCRRVEHLVPEDDRHRLPGLEYVADSRPFRRFGNLLGRGVVDVVEADKAAGWAAVAKATTGDAAGACASAAVACASVAGSFGSENDARLRLADAPQDRERFLKERAAQADLLRSMCDPFRG
jgi:hypothetical protein